ncbi:hypothetical protein Ancab_014279 [Ancistrocladus abbreviatus]
MEEIASTNQSVFEEWFETIRPWSKYDKGNGRFAWIRASGIPLHIWEMVNIKVDEDVFLIQVVEEASNPARWSEETQLAAKEDRHASFNDLNDKTKETEGGPSFAGGHKEDTEKVHGPWDNRPASLANKTYLIAPGKKMGRRTKKKALEEVAVQMGSRKIEKMYVF